MSEAVNIYETTISEALKQIGVDHFLLSRHTDRLSLHQLTVTWNDPHPSAEASNLIANQIFDELQKRGIATTPDD